MPLPNPALVRLLQAAYSAERAAAFAYRGHAGSVRANEEREVLARIEREEWEHRECVGEILDALDHSPSPFLEIKYLLVGKFIGVSCYLIGWFLPMYFAGRLESGNVNEYVELKKLLNEAGHSKWDAAIIQMTDAEKEHEVFFAEAVTGHWMLPLFSAVFGWGPNRSFNTWELPVTEDLAS